MERAVPHALEAFFEAHSRLALAFSGGTDSAYLLYAAKVCGCDATAYCIQSAFQTATELAEARRLAASLDAPLKVIPMDVLSDPIIRANPPDRCYHCKRRLFSALLQQAEADGYKTVIDGTNATDDAGDRPGMRALSELGVLSPLRLCGIGKAEIREYSRRAGLPTWDKPACACLATRVPTGEPIADEALRRVEGAERALYALGFSDLRVRLYHGAARIQLRAGQLEQAVARRGELRAALKPWFEIILLDTEDRG